MRSLAKLWRKCWCPYSRMSVAPTAPVPLFHHCHIVPLLAHQSPFILRHPTDVPSHSQITEDTNISLFLQSPHEVQDSWQVVFYLSAVNSLMCLTVTKDLWDLRFLLWCFWGAGYSGMWWDVTLCYWTSSCKHMPLFSWVKLSNQNDCLTLWWWRHYVCLQRQYHSYRDTASHACRLEPST